MNEDPRPLLALQRLDLEIAAHDDMLAESAARRQETLRGKEEASQVLAQSQKSLAAGRLRLKQAEQSMQELEEAKGKLLRQSATIKKNDEYQAAMAQIAELTAAHEKAMEKVLDAMESIDKQEADFQEHKEKTSLLFQELDGNLQKIQEQAAKLAAERKELTRQRTEAAHAVDPTLLSRYELLRASRIYSPRQPALVSVDQEACARCHRRIPMQHRDKAQRGELTTCENCGAILYSEAYLHEEDIHI